MNDQDFIGDSEGKGDPLDHISMPKDGTEAGGSTVAKRAVA